MRVRDVLLMGVVAMLPAVGRGQFALHDGDTVVFYGDSITAQRLYTRDVEEAVWTRYPAMHVRFVNAGVPGDQVSGGYAGAMAERVARDVAPYKPTMIVIMLGMNDGWYQPYSEKMNSTFREGYAKLLAALKQAAPDARVTFVTPTPYDEVTHGTDFPGYGDTVARNAAAVRGMYQAYAQANGKGRAYVADCWAAMTWALQHAKKNAPEEAVWLVPDRIHPGEAGHWIMAAEVLRAWGADPVVASVLLKGAKVVEHHNTSVTDVRAVDGGLAWTQMDAALPLPLTQGEPMTELVLKVSDVRKYDREMLQVDGMAAGSYALMVDGKELGSYSAEQLGAGIDLALVRTPMLEQARGADWWGQRKSALDLASFIMVVEMTKDDGLPALQKELARGEEEMVAMAREKLKPVAHRFELRKR
jgi:lysophospholipase L1-like esterase